MSGDNRTGTEEGFTKQQAAWDQHLNDAAIGGIAPPSEVINRIAYCMCDRCRRQQVFDPSDPSAARAFLESIGWKVSDTICPICSGPQKRDDLSVASGVPQ